MHYIVKNSCNNPGPGWIELLEEVLSKYSATNSTPAINVNIMSELDGTPLYVTCKLGNLDAVNVFLKYRADPSVYGFLYRSLHYALRESKIDIAKVLLKHRAETIGLRPSEITKFSKSAVECSYHIYLIRKKAECYNPLLTAIMRELITILRL